jgi:hypothetical protein
MMPKLDTFLESFMRIAKRPRVAGRVSGALAALLMATLSLLVGPASAHAASASPADGVIAQFHRCENFGIAHRGYIAAQCIDVYEHFDSGVGYIEAQGQSFCQTAITHAIVQCAGIEQTLRTSTPWNAGGADSYYCGAPNAAPACPAGRFQNQWATGNYFPVGCGIPYTVQVMTTVELPVSNDVVTSDLYGETVTLC